MYKLFEKIDFKLGSRYKTIETNIKAKSNSFYESLLALLEGLAKIIVKNEKILIDSDYDTLIGILKTNDFRSFSYSINFLSSDYENLFKIAKSINSHKHDNEATIELSTVLEYLEITFRFARSYFLKLFGECEFNFSNKEITDMYGQTEKENKRLILEKKKLEESLLSENTKSSLLESDLQKVLEIKNQEVKKRELKEFEFESAQKQNDYLKTQINELKDIKLTSMEEKVGAILSALKTQTKALNDMTIQLSYNADLQLKTINATIASGKPTIRQDGYSSPKNPYIVNFTDYERYVLKLEYVKQAKDYTFNKIKEISKDPKKKESYQGLKNFTISANLDSVSVIYKANNKVFSKTIDENIFKLWFRKFNRYKSQDDTQINNEYEMIELLFITISSEACTNTPSDKLLEQFYISNNTFNPNFDSSL
jgi:uncharacterized protein YehS (DUF1456 family)